MTIQRLSRFGIVPSNVMGVRVRSPIGRKPAWWQVAGKTCVAAYQPKGASSLAASYVNLANPGTYDAAPGVAPTLTADGWQGTASAYLTTGIVPTTGNWSVILRFSNAPLGAFAIGSQNSNATSTYFLRCNAAGNPYGYGDNSGFGSGGRSAGVMALASNNAYLDGIGVGSVVTTWTGPAVEFYILARNLSPTASGFFNGGIVSGVAIYSSTLTSGEVATVSAAMAAL